MFPNSAMFYREIGLMKRCDRLLNATVVLQDIPMGRFGATEQQAVMNLRLD
jgi:hypothetical protein